MDVFEEARNIISGDRQDDYGNPEDSFSLISDFWDIYIYHKYTKNSNVELNITPKDVGIMMVLLKIARSVGQNDKHDNYVDAIGYLGIVDERLR